MSSDELEAAAGSCAAGYPLQTCSKSDYSEEFLGNMRETRLYWELCGGSYDDSTGTSWGLACAYQAVRKLDAVCDKTFEPTPPEAERQLDESPLADDGVDCAARAFCAACVDETGRIDDACRAVVLSYGSLRITSPVANFMLDIDQWCAWTRGRASRSALATDEHPLAAFAHRSVSPPVAILAVLGALVVVAATLTSSRDRARDLDYHAAPYLNSYSLERETTPLIARLPKTQLTRTGTL